MNFFEVKVKHQNFDGRKKSTGIIYTDSVSSSEVLASNELRDSEPIVTGSTDKPYVEVLVNRDVRMDYWFEVTIATESLEGKVFKETYLVQANNAEDAMNLVTVKYNEDPTARVVKLSEKAVDFYISPSLDVIGEYEVIY